MPDRPRKPKRPRDINELACVLVQESLGEAPPESEEEDTRNPHAVALGKLGGKKGGKARAEKMNPERRSEMAKRAAPASGHHHVVMSPAAQAMQL